MNWRTGNNRRKSPRRLCGLVGHSAGFGYGFAFGGGIGAYEFCERCGTLITKTLDGDDDE